MGPEKEKEQEMVGSFNSMTINPSQVVNKEISMNIIKESTKVPTSRPPMKTQQVQPISSNTPQNSSFTSSVSYDSSRIAEFILNTLPETPGEDEIFDSFLKNRDNTKTYDQEERLSDSMIIESSSPSRPMSDNGQSSTNKCTSQISMTPGQRFTNQKRKSSSSYTGASDPVTISDEDDERNGRRISKGTKQNYYNLNLNEEEEDYAWITEKERMVKLYSHKLHLRKPRMQDPNLCSHEIEFLSDFDDDDDL